jgi:hypothetical protein
VEKCLKIGQEEKTNRGEEHNKKAPVTKKIFANMGLPVVLIQFG